MFTGLVEETGIIKNIKTLSSGCVLTMSCKKILEDLKIGDSISVNGVCQTAIEKSVNTFITELSNETLKITNFNKISIGEEVNLERALKADSRLGGHIVNGHIDCIAALINVQKDGFSSVYSFKINENFKKYLLYKASITLNGVSLTISSTKDDIFSTAVIPATLASTNLKKLKTGDMVNVEIDILAKYIEKFLLLNNNVTTTIDNSFLELNGFI